MPRFVSCSLVWSLFLICSAPAVFGQDITSGIRGTVTDPTGAVIAAAKVSVRELNTGFIREASTDAAGGYVFTLLPVGTYDLTVEMAGFKKHTRSGIVLTVNQVAGVNLTLELGEVTQTVEVVGGDVSVNTQTSEVGTLVESVAIRELPLNTRNPIQLAALTAGVSRTIVPQYLGQGGGTVTDTIDGGGAILNVNGNRLHNTQFNLDGGNYASVHYDSGLNYPNPDALQEFRFITGNYSAEFGRNLGGVMNVVTKSGTNDIHGTIFEFNRNSKFASRSFFDPSISFLNQNQFGFTIGGPVVKDKLFLFGTGQWLKIAKQDVGQGNFVPNADERRGDLSKTTTPIIDPDTGQAFPGNIIPSSRIDPVAAAILNLVPLPNQPNGTLFQQLGAPVNNHQYLIKADYHLSSINRLSGSFFQDYTQGQQPFSRGGAGGGIQYTNVTGPNFQENAGTISTIFANDTHTFSPNLLNQARFGYVRVRAVNGQSQPVGPTMRDLNPKWPFPADQLMDRPGIWISGRAFASRGVWGAQNTDDYQFSDSINYIRKNHNIKVGGEVRRAKLENIGSQNNQGIFWATGGVTGNSLADWLLGRPQGIVVGPTTVRTHQVSYAGFVQDDYKVTRKLVLNLGVRYQYADSWNPENVFKLADGTPHNGIAVFRQGLQSQIFPNAPRGFLYAGDPGVPQNGAPGEKNNIMPRVGFAADVFGTGQTSLRGGFGIFYQLQSQRYMGNSQYSPFGGGNVSINPIPVPLSQWIPPGIPAPDPPNNFDFTPLLPFGAGGQVLSLSHPQRNAQAFQYNLTINQKITDGVSLAVGYVGNQAHRLAWPRAVNQAVYYPGNNSDGSPISTGTNLTARRPLNGPFPQPSGTVLQYGDIGLLDFSGNSNYNSLQIELRTRSYRGLTLLGSYVWSKAIDDNSLEFTGLASSALQDSNCLSCDRGVASFHRAHRFVISYVYEAPPLSRALNTDNVVVKKAFDGWGFSGITTLTSGPPFSVNTGTDNSRSGIGKDRADSTGVDPTLPSNRSKDEKLAKWFNTAAFVPNQIGKFGSAGRNILIAPGSTNTDFAILKDTPFWGEGRRLQLRFEFFNLFNKANFGGPGAQVGAPGYGTIVSAGPGRIVQFGGKILF